MTESNPTEPIPSEFAVFIREIGVKAFDLLAGRVKEVDAPLRVILRNWNRLSDDEKQTLFEALIGCAQLPTMPPAEKPPKREIKRYDPAEVAKTLPAKPRKKPGA